MKLIVIWANKNNSNNWLQDANRTDCRNRQGYSKVGYIGYDVETHGEHTSFSYTDAFYQTDKATVLTVNVDSIKEKV